MEATGGFARLGPVGDLDLRPVFQPIVDLRDGGVVGYEALMRSGPEDGALHMAGPMLAAARREDSVAALDHAARDAAIATAERAGLGSPFCLFLNTDAISLEDEVPLPDSSLTLLMDVTEQALIERPEAVLRALTELRIRGWGIALDDVGADSGSLALTSVLYPDVIKLDLRLLDDRSPEDVARIVMAVGAEAERRHAVILAEGIHSAERLDAARIYGATLGQGYHLGLPGQLPDPLPEPGRSLRLAGGGGDPFGATPWQRVTNWRRPVRGPRALAARALEPLLVHAADVGQTAMVLGCLVHERYAVSAVRRFGWLRERVAFVGILNAGDAFAGTGVRSGRLAPDDPLRGTATLVALAPDFAACYVTREDGDAWEWAVSYDRETVVECALQLIARMEPLA
jgi:EAL domain-containing protein (putative c-di-GMP-specific phosphodiesterase class I)